MVSRTCLPIRLMIGYLTFGSPSKKLVKLQKTTVAKRKTSTKKTLPQRHESHISEDESRTIFEAAIKPWMICSWNQRDYGIDAMVEITTTIASSRSQLVTGKRFSLQLKSSRSLKIKNGHISLSVERSKIHYWYHSIEPVLIVLVDLQTKQSHYCWIDDLLIDELFAKNPQWIAQYSVTLNFSNEKQIGKSTLPELEHYVNKWKRPAKTIIAPGSYFQYNAELRHYIQQVSEVSNLHGVNALKANIMDMHSRIGSAIYTIAVVGPSRVGKSTLINCLLQQKVSPVGVFPTTGIPITFSPRDHNRSEILFKDKRKISGPISHDFLEQYTSQQHNRDNQKGVEMVSVSIVNLLLEKGLALCDVPGLDDPDEEIRNVTRAALNAVGAIVYVINAGPMCDGGFCITRQMIEELHSLGRQKERLFIVINKMDLLNEEQTVLIKEYVEAEFDRYGISDFLPVKPLYISSDLSFKNRMSMNNTADTVTQLEDQVWTFLLEQNKTGMHKLLGDYDSSRQLLEQLLRVISTRLIHAERRSEIEKEVSEVEKEIDDVKTKVPEFVEHVKSLLKSNTEQFFANVLHYLETELRATPLTRQLVSDTDIMRWLEENANRIVRDVYELMNRELASLGDAINQWIAQYLKQMELDLDNASREPAKQLPAVEYYSGFVDSYFEDRRRGHTGILERLLSGIGKTIGNFLEAVEEAFLSPQTRRELQVKQAMRKSKRVSDRITTDLVFYLHVYLQAYGEVMVDKAVERTKVYLHGLKEQLSQLDTPLTDLERENFHKCKESLMSIDTELYTRYLNLKEYANGIEARP